MVLAYYGGMYYMDPTYVLVLIGFVLCLLASAFVRSAMAKYQKVPNQYGLSGAEAAKRILEREGLGQVHVECLAENEGDHYDPRTSTVRLSRANYMSASITAVSVAAHECGHAIQHAKGYLPLSIRTALVPAANLGSQLGVPIIFVGILLSFNEVLITAGIWLFALAVLFQVVTLPVEFNASRRGIQKIDQLGLLSAQENKGAKTVLFAAALTYVAAAASSALQLLRLVLLYGGRGNSGSRRR